MVDRKKNANCKQQQVVPPAIKEMRKELRLAKCKANNHVGLGRADWKICPPSVLLGPNKGLGM